MKVLQSTLKHFFKIISFFAPHHLSITLSFTVQLRTSGKESTLILVTRLLIIASQLAPHGGPYAISSEEDGSMPTNIIRTKINFRCPKLRKSIAPIDLFFLLKICYVLPSGFLELIRRFQLLCSCQVIFELVKEECQFALTTEKSLISEVDVDSKKLF